MTDIQGTTMDGIVYDIYSRPSFSTLIFHLQQGQSVTAEPGALMYMHRTIEIQTHSRGGVLKGLKVMALGGESFFVNTFVASQGPGDLALVPPTMGDIIPINLQGFGMVVQDTAYLANTQGVNIDTKWAGLKGFLAEKQFVMLHVSGNGTVFLNSFGSIIQRDLQPGEVMCVDNGHIVAYSDNMQVNIRTVGGLKSTVLGGEGYVVDLTGPGRVILQTRTLPWFAQSLARYLPQR